MAPVIPRRRVRSVLELVVAALVAAPAAADPRLLEYLERHPPEKRFERAYTEAELELVEPRWPNPYLSFLPAEAEPDFGYWRARARQQARDRIAARPEAAAGAAEPRLVVTESEPNDSRSSADFIEGLGTDDGETRRADVSGSLSALPPSSLGPGAEDDGSIPLARATGLGDGGAVRASGSIGDGAFGSAGTGSGDFDFFRIGDVAPGQTILVDVDTPLPFQPLDPFVVVYDAAGNALDFNDDDGSSFDSFLEFVAPAAGDYYVSIGGFASFALQDPFDSASGPGVGSEGSYEVLIGLDAKDVDFFGFELAPGDVFGANASGSATRLRLFAPDGELRIASSQDLSFIHPLASPLPGGGEAVLSYVIETPGTWSIAVSGDEGAYALELLLSTSPLLDAEEGAVQTLFLDFDGATIDARIFGGSGSRTLSPLATFLPNWGLGASDEDRVIDAILAAVEENVSADVRSLGSNGDFELSGRAGDFDLVILNSRDHEDPAELPDVSRVVVGGTIAELGILTLAIAESIDPGNFEAEETAVVLLDLLSSTARNNPNSLNRIRLTDGASIVDLIGIAVGNIAAHEAGHFFGNFHTEQFLTPPNIMDQGGNLPNTIGLGADAAFGGPDDVDVDLGRDSYVPNEGFKGVEDTLEVIAFGLPTPIVTLEVELEVKPGATTAVINPDSHGTIQLAVLGSESLDVAAIDQSSLEFGPAGAAPTGPGVQTDVDGDGLDDLKLALRTQETGLSAGDTTLCVAGWTLEQTPIAGCGGLHSVPLHCSFDLPGGGEGNFFPAGPANGGFELGSLDGWMQLDIGSGGITLDDGLFDPLGPGRPVRPFEGSFAAASFQGGPGLHVLFTDLALDPDLVEAKLHWADHLENHAGVFQDPDQEWRVEVWSPADNGVLAELYSTGPGDPPLRDWTVREADLSAWIGQTIRLAFSQQDSLFFFNARLDDVRLLVRRQMEVELDIRPGSSQNAVQPGSGGVVPVAILGSELLDVASLDVLTLGFGPDGAPPAHVLCDDELLGAHLRDLDSDGHDDLLVHFAVGEAGIAIGDDSACVVGALRDGTEIRGCDAVSTPMAMPTVGVEEGVDPFVGDEVGPVSPLAAGGEVTEPGTGDADPGGQGTAAASGGANLGAEVPALSSAAAVGLGALMAALARGAVRRRGRPGRE